VKDYRIADIRASAAKVLDHVKLTDVRLATLTADAAGPVAPGPFDVSTDISWKAVLGENTIEVWAQYGVAAVRAADIRADGTAPNSVWSIEMEQVGSWTITTPVQFADDELDCFAMAVGVMVVHPYARTTVQNIVGQLGYPPFTLEMMTNLAEGDADDTVRVGTPDEVAAELANELSDQRTNV
jgi:hypothetical protein